MRFQAAIFNPTTDTLIADWTVSATACQFSTGVHGFESCEIEIILPFFEAFLYYQQIGVLKLKLSWGGMRIWEGRIDDPTQFSDTESGLKIVALGQWVALSDIPITALWSDSQLKLWEEGDKAIFAANVFAQFDQRNRLYGTLEKNTTTPAGAAFGFQYRAPDQSVRPIVGISVDYSVTLPLNWQFYIQADTDAGTFLASLLTLNATGANQVGSLNLTYSNASFYRIHLFAYNNTGGNYANVAENGIYFFAITNVRVITSITNRISTTLSANRNAGTNVIATVGSTAGMYVGQRLQINSNGNPSESVIVLSIGSSTQFNATFANNYVIGNAVQAHVVYPDEIIKHCVTTITSINSTQISSATNAIQSQAIDLENALFENMYPNDIINDLIAKSDNQTPPRQWLAQVYDNALLSVAPNGSGRAWVTDIESLEVTRTLLNLINSVYATYVDGSGRSLRTQSNTSTDSVARFGVTRRTAINTEAITLNNAEKIRDSVLAAQQDPIPRAKVTLHAVYDSAGVPYPLFLVRAGDTLTLRNLPPTLGFVYDKIRTLIIARTMYDTMLDTLTLELEAATPAIDVQMAQALRRGD